jgi:hypothetical protein
MGGGGSGGSYSIDLSELTAAAGERIREIVESGVKVLFVSENGDLVSLRSHLVRSQVFTNGSYEVLASTDIEEFRRRIESFNVVVAFTNIAKDFGFLNEVADVVLVKRKQGIHARAISDASIPAKISAYRWPSLSWEKLEEMFTE